MTWQKIQKILLVLLEEKAMFNAKFATLALLALTVIAVLPLACAFTAIQHRNADSHFQNRRFTRLHALGYNSKSVYPPEPHWYTLHVRAHKEMDVYARLRAMCSVVPLEGKLLEVMLPTVFVPEMRDDAVDLVPQVLTHGHVMVRARMSEWIRKSLAGVPDVFGFLGRDAAAPLTEEQALALLELQHKGQQMPTYLQGARRGDWFEILVGTYARRRGRLVDVRSGLLGFDLEHGNKRVYVDMFNCKRTLMITDKPGGAPEHQLVPEEVDVPAQTDILRSKSQKWSRYISRRERHIMMNNLPVDVADRIFFPGSEGAAYVSDTFATLAAGDSLESVMYGSYFGTEKSTKATEHIRKRAAELGLVNDTMILDDDATAFLGQTQRYFDTPSELRTRFKELQMKAQMRMWMANSLDMLTRLRTTPLWQKLQAKAV